MRLFEGWRFGAELGQVVLSVEDLHVGDQRGAFAHQVHAAAQEVLGLAQTLGIDVGDRDVLAAAQVGDPVPGEQALDGDDDIWPEGGEDVEQEFRIVGDLRAYDDVVGLMIDDADGSLPKILAFTPRGLENDNRSAMAIEVLRC